MFTLVRLDNPPPESLKNQILQMVVDYFSDISPVSLAPDNPLYPLYQYVIGYQVHLYLQAMDGARQDSPRLLLALADEDPSVVLGFALYLPFKDQAQACALAYLAVDADHHRCGMAQAMLREMVSRYPHTELACVAAKVPCFEAMGFRVLAARGPQVLMNTRSQACEGLVAVQDLAPIYQSREVRQIHAYLLKQHGEQAMREAEETRDLGFDQLANQAQACVRERRLH